MFQIRLLNIAILSIFGLSANSIAETTDVRDVIKETLATNPRVLRELRQVDARNREVRQALAGYYPTLDLNAGFGWQERDPVVGRDPFSGELSPGIFGGKTDRSRNELERSETQLTLSQLVFDGFRTQNEYYNQQSREKSAKLRSESVAQTVALAVVRVYVDVMKRETILVIAEEALIFHEDVYSKMKKRFDQGAGSEADLDQISGRLALAKTNAVVAANNLIDSRTNFQRVVGRMPNQGELAMPGTYRKYLPANVEEAVERAKSNHPLIKTANVDIEAVQYTYEQTKSVNYPSFHVEATRDWNNNIDGTEGSIDDTKVMLRMRYNLYNGGADEARTEQFAYLVEEAKEIRNGAIRAVQEETRLSWAELEALQLQMPDLESHVVDSLATREAYAQQFDLGRRTLLDLLNTENEYIDARVNHQDAWYNTLVVEYRVFHAMGDLLYIVGAEI
jgi:adhesin transport system outer membrane protein